MRRPLLFLVGVYLMFTAVASAQAPATGGPDPATVRVRLGPLFMNPTVSLTNMGVDTNVFNEPTDQNPKRDFTLTVEPRTDLWLRVGPTWVTGVLGEQVVWYQKYASERSSNSRYQIGWSVPLNRLSFKINGVLNKTRDRPGFEIDTRAKRGEKSVDGVIEFRVLAKTFFGLRGGESKTDFAKDQLFLKQDLQTELNRTSRSAGLVVRNQLTPLTNVTFDVSRSQDRFEFTPLRNSDSTAITVGVAFDPFALLKGGATFGYRNFRPLVSTVPEFKGGTVNVDLSYVLLGSTKFGVTVNRDVQYSFDVNQPYYVQTGYAASLAQQVFGPLDVVGRFAWAGLGYRDRAGATIQASNRTDHSKTYGGGLGYHVGKELRIGVNVDQSQRTSPLTNREYKGLRIGTAVTYGT